MDGNILKTSLTELTVHYSRRSAAGQRRENVASRPIETAGPAVQLFARGPQASRRRGNEIESFAVGQRVPAFFEPLGLVARQHLRQVGVAKVDPLDFLGGKLPRGIGDREAVLGRTVDQVR